MKLFFIAVNLCKNFFLFTVVNVNEKFTHGSVIFFLEAA